MQKDGYREPAIEKLLAEACRNREREIGQQLNGRLRQNPFPEGLQGAPRFDGKFPYAPQVQPLKGRDYQRTSDRGDKNSASVLDCQTQLGGRESVCLCPPCHYCDGDPLKGNRRGIKGKPLRSADVWHRQKFLHAHSTTPRQNHAEHQENQPDVPRHPRMRTLSTGSRKGPKYRGRQALIGQARTTAHRYNREALKRG